LKKYILTIDQSTSATKAILFDNNGNIINRCNVSHKQYYPKPGWVEHDGEEIYLNTLKAVQTLLNETRVNAEEISVITISNQRETAIIWDKKTGKPVYNAIVWQCQRALDICNELKEKGYSDVVHEKTGLVLSPYFSASKLKWIMDNVEGVKEKSQNGELLLGTIDSWLIWKLTKGKVHATDYTNACRTQLFNIKKLQWDNELLEIFSIPSNMLPKVCSSNAIFGATDFEGVLNKEINISGIMGDSNAALFGQCCFQQGLTKITYGTGSSIMMNIGDAPIISNKGLLTSIAWGIDDKINYVLDGNITCSGASIQWIINNLDLLTSSKESESLAKQVKDSEGVYLIPAFAGLGAPYWDSSAKGAIIGLTMGTKKAHIVRATLESIAYQVKDIIDIMTEESAIDLKELRVDGGPTRNDLLMQFQSDIIDANVIRNHIEELSALGTAYMGGLAVGMWKDLKEIMALREIDHVFKSQMDDELRSKLYSGWKEAVKKVLL